MNLKFEFTADEVIEEGVCQRKDLEELKMWIKNTDLPKATDEQIILFLLSCDGNIEYTKTTIKAYYYFMYHGKNITNNRNINSAEMIQQTKIVESIVIPRRTKDNNLVLFQKLKDFSYWNFNIETSIKYLFMTLDLGLIGKPPPKGLVTVFDMTGVTLMHLTRLRIGAIKIFVHLLQEACPCRVKSIHVLNSTHFVDKLIAILKPLMKKELYEKLHFHPPSINMEEFFEKHVEAECLPSDYGGKLPSVKVLSEETLERMRKHSDWFEIEENMRKNYKPHSR